MFANPRTILSLLCLILVSVPAFALELDRMELDNGLEVLMRESHAGEMVASIVTIGAGSRWEDESSFGASHFLEHMLFNGTATRSREEINEGIKAYGGYINAFTRRDYTCFILLIPSEYMREGLAIQADMLFGSILPGDEFEKEKLIVLEEMNKDYDSGSYHDDQFRNAALMEGTPYASPILGTVETISELSRQGVLDYYKTRYRPANSRMYLMGDFDRDAANDLLMELFGGYTSEPAPAGAITMPEWSAEGEYHHHRAEEGAPRLDIFWRAPGIRERLYPAQRVLTGILEDEFRSPLRNGAGGVLDAGLSFEQYEGFSICHLSMDPSERGVAGTLEFLRERLRCLIEWEPDGDFVNEIAKGQRFDDVLLSDTFHFFAMMASPDLHYGGYDYLATSDQALRDLRPAAISRALATSLLGSAPLVIHSAVEGGPESLPAELLSGFPRLDADDGTAEVAIEVSTRKTGRNLEKMKRDRKRGGRIKTRREVLDNGLTVVIKSDPSGEVFASHLLVRGRSALEPEGQAGIVTLAHDLLTAGAGGMDEEAIAAEITRLGVRLKKIDNPWIPFDDYYTREDYSWLRLECLDESGLEALDLLALLISEAEYPPAAVAAVKGKMMGALRGAGRPVSVAREALYGSIFAGGGRGLPVKGTAETVMAITPEDLQAFHGRYFDPRRMVLSVVSGLPAGKVLARIKEGFGKLEPGEVEIPSATISGGPGEIRLPMDKTQVTIMGGRVIPDLRNIEPGLSVLVDVLSTRMGLELREKQGLAYSLGAGLRYIPGLTEDDSGFALLSFQISTSAANRERAVEGVLTELRRMASEPPTEEEIFLSVNDSWGRGLMRNLSRIHQAYQMGMAEHLGRDPFAGRADQVRSQRSLTPEKLGSLAAKYLLQADWEWIYAGGGL